MGIANPLKLLEYYLKLRIKYGKENIIERSLFDGDAGSDGSGGWRDGRIHASRAYFLLQDQEGMLRYSCGAVEDSLAENP